MNKTDKNQQLRFSCMNFHSIYVGAVADVFKESDKVPSYVCLSILGGMHDLHIECESYKHRMCVVNGFIAFLRAAGTFSYVYYIYIYIY